MSYNPTVKSYTCSHFSDAMLQNNVCELTETIFRIGPGKRWSKSSVNERNVSFSCLMQSEIYRNADLNFACKFQNLPGIQIYRNAFPFPWTLVISTVSKNIQGVPTGIIHAAREFRAAETIWVHYLDMKTTNVCADYQGCSFLRTSWRASRK
jgi:hypothetical protein